MTISKDLFLAILAMDSYNRGYGSGISDGGTDDLDGLGDDPETRIGTAVILDVDLPQGAQPAGFYAVAYTIGAGVDGITPGTTVISYRGTDGLTLGGDTIQGGSDIINGWLAGAGQGQAVGWVPTHHPQHKISHTSENRP